MSEYQYYEFRAIDRHLTAQEMAKLRAISSRAHISATSFVNVYNYGDFRGDPAALVEMYFDAFVYVANWGTHHLMLRLPKKVFGNKESAPYCRSDTLQVRRKGDYTIVSFRADELESNWVDEGEEWMDALLPIRADLLRGDLRSLYLGWLAAVQMEHVDDDEPEPPLPAGLRNLSAPLRSLAEFLDIDTDLFETAAELSADLETPAASKDMLSQWISALPDAEKNRVLLQVASEEDPHAVAGLVRRFQQECLKVTDRTPSAPRTAGELRAAADRATKAREHREEELRRLERERQEKERAVKRAKYLDALEKREEDSWTQLDLLIATKRQNDYDRAVILLQDLRDVSARKDCSAIFRGRLRNLRERHAGKSSFMRKLNEGGLDL
jgi:hypothetical protein